MAATCQERGITHMKDIFSQDMKTKDENIEEYFFGINSNSNDRNSKSLNKSKSNNKPGAFVLRSGRDVDVREIPVPPPNRSNAFKKSAVNQNPYTTPSNVQRDRSLSPKKYSAPLPPPIASPPPPPPNLRRLDSFPPPPPPSIPPPSLPSSPTSPASHYSRSPVAKNMPSPSYTKTITAEVHHSNTSPFGSRDFDDDDGDILNNLDTRMFNTEKITLPREKPENCSGDSEIITIENDKDFKGRRNVSPLFKKYSGKKSSELKGKFAGNRMSKNYSNDIETDSSLLNADSTSSGYFSEFSNTSDSNRKNLPSPNSSTALKSPSNTINESSSFEEDECTFIFEEDDFFESKHKKVYHEYQGEDFAQYLQDDDHINSTTLARRIQKQKQKQQQQYLQQRKPGIKQKITEAFTLTRSDKKYSGHHSQINSQPKNKIHSFSFVNSKMGMYASEEELHDYINRDLETKSDIGGLKKSPRPSWHQDTLSASTLKRAKHLYNSKSAMSTSVPNLTQEINTGFSPPNSPNSYHHGAFSDFGADITHKKNVNRFKFWKIFRNKKSKKNKTVTNPDLKIEPQIVDIRL